MARFTLDRALNAIVNGAVIAAAASATAWAPDAVWDVLQPKLTASGFSVLSSDYDEAGVIVTHSTTISCNNNSETLMLWNTEPTNGDLRGFHDTGSNTDRLTVPTGYGGLYFGFCRIQTPGNSVGRRQIAVYDDTAATVGQMLIAAGTGNTGFLTCPFWCVLTAGQWVQAKYIQDSSGALNITPVSFSMFRAVRI